VEKKNILKEKIETIIKSVPQEEIDITKNLTSILDNLTKL
jgi:hypothetical protein